MDREREEEASEESEEEMIDEKNLLSEIAKTCPECYTVVSSVINHRLNVETRRGHWEDAYDESMNGFFRQGWRCSVCENRQTYGRTKWCPNCGAYMRGEE